MTWKKTLDVSNRLSILCSLCICRPFTVQCVIFVPRLGGSMAALVSVVFMFSQLWWRAADSLSCLQLSSLPWHQSTEQNLQYTSLPWSVSNFFTQSSNFRYYESFMSIKTRFDGLWFLFLKMWAALLADFTGSVIMEKAALSAALRSVEKKAATLTVVKKAATVPLRPTNIVDSAYRWVSQPVKAQLTKLYTYWLFNVYVSGVPMSGG